MSCALPSACLKTSAHGDALSQEVIQQAEAQLKAASQTPGYCTSVLSVRNIPGWLLCLVGDTAMADPEADLSQVVATEALDPSVRQAAAVNFKNHVKFNWVGLRGREGRNGACFLHVPCAMRAPLCLNPPGSHASCRCIGDMMYGPCLQQHGLHNGMQVPSETATYSGAQQVPQPEKVSTRFGGCPQLLPQVSKHEERPRQLAPGVVHQTTPLTICSTYSYTLTTFTGLWLPSYFRFVLPAQEQVKAMLPGLMLSTPALVQAQLSEALSIICGHDFPRAWPNLLGELVERLKTSDLQAINGVLATANSIFKRYRCAHSPVPGLGARPHGVCVLTVCPALHLATYGLRTSGGM